MELQPIPPASSHPGLKRLLDQLLSSLTHHQVRSILSLLASLLWLFQVNLDQKTSEKTCLTVPKFDCKLDPSVKFSPHQSEYLSGDQSLKKKKKLSSACTSKEQHSLGSSGLAQSRTEQSAPSLAGPLWQCVTQSEARKERNRNLHPLARTSTYCHYHRKIISMLLTVLQTIRP